MLTHDTAAFVEQIAVAKPDRRAAKLRRHTASAELEAAHIGLELRLAEDALQRLQADAERQDAPGLFGLRRRRRAAKHDAYAQMVGDLRARLAEVRAHGSEVGRRALEQEAAGSTNTWYRIHSAEHHTTYSESEFERIRTEQRTRATLLMKAGRVSWWWYSDRFWWDDDGLRASEVESQVLELDRDAERQRNAERRRMAVTQGDMPPALTVAELAIPDVVRQAVWRRDEARCVHCGDDRDLVFHVNVPISRGGSMEPSNVELRCPRCHALGRQLVAVADSRGRRDRPIS